MTEKKLTLISVEVDGYCDPETGFCVLPGAEGASADAADTSAEESSTP